MKPKKNKIQFLSLRYIDDLNRFSTLLTDCCNTFGVNADELCSPSREQSRVFARYMFCHIAVHSLFQRQLDGVHNQELIAQLICRKKAAVSYFKKHAPEIYLYCKHFREIVDQSPYKTYFQTITK